MKRRGTEAQEAQGFTALAAGPLVKSGDSPRLQGGGGGRGGEVDSLPGFSSP